MRAGGQEHPSSDSNMDDGSVVTCTACRARLLSSEERRQHYRSDLHRVNLKRKVGGLGPLSADEFGERLQALQTDEERKRRERQTQFCDACSKKFSSVRAMQNHVQSRRHRDAVRALAQAEDGALLDASTMGSDDESDAADMELERRLAETEGIAPSVCVFDDEELTGVEENLAYMARKFGFFLPYVESLVDAEGLLAYLGQKVGIGYACVECDRAFTSVGAVQRHMRDKQHCRMTKDDNLWVEEYGEFYDFSSADDGEDGDWEEVEGEEAGEVLADKNAELVVAGAREPLRLGSADDGMQEEVALAIGKKVIGHRSLRTYYKQNTREEDGRYAVVANKLMNEYRLLGWKGQDKNVMPLNVRRSEVKRNKRFDLKVGGQNYYTRKATFKQSMAVFNSGYRA